MFFESFFVGLLFIGAFSLVASLVKVRGRKITVQTLPDIAYEDMHEVNISPEDRILIVAPHPDDAALSCSGLIKQAIKKGADVKVVYITYGSHSSDTIIKSPSLLLPMPLSSIIKQGRVRHDEAVAAMFSLGLNASDIIFLGFPDSGTLKMWADYFNNKSLTSAALVTNKVVYKTAYKPGVRFNAVNEFNLLKEVIKFFRPTKIIYSDMADLNPDHRATGLFVNAVLFDLKKENLNPLGLSYFVHAKNWPNDGSVLTPPSYFTHPLKGKWFYLNITLSDMKDKLNAIKAHEIPLKVKPDFLLSFVKKNELFFKSEYYQLEGNLPLWKPKELQKLGVLNYVSDIKISEKKDYISFSFFTQPNLSAFSKVYLFVYPIDTNKNFLDTPKYRIILKRGTRRTSVKLIDGRSRIHLTSKENIHLKTIDKNHIQVYMNKGLLEKGSYFFFSMQLEKLNVRVGETPWWIIQLKNPERAK